MHITEMTPAQAADELAKLAAARREAPPSHIAKTAMQLTDMFTALGYNTKLSNTLTKQALVENPMVGGTLLGAGIGGLAGGAAGLLGPGSFKDKRKAAWRGLVSGGLAGGLTGLGTGAVIKANPDLPNKLHGMLGQGPGGAVSGGRNNDSLSSIATDAVVKQAPEILKDHPDLPAKLKDLTTPSVEAQFGRGVLGAGGLAAYYAPMTTAAGAGLAIDKGVRGIAAAKERHGRYTAQDVVTGLRSMKDEATKGKRNVIDKFLNKMTDAEREAAINAATGANNGRMSRVIGGQRNPFNWNFKELFKSNPVVDPDAVVATSKTKPDIKTVAETHGNLKKLFGDEKPKGQGAAPAAGQPPAPAPVKSQARQTVEAELKRMREYAAKESKRALKPVKQTLHNRDLLEAARIGRQNLITEKGKLPVGVNMRPAILGGAILGDVGLNAMRGLSREQHDNAELQRILQDIAKKVQERGQQ